MAATTWVLDPTHSEIQFKAKHLVISTVTGNFNSFDGKVVSENEDFTDADIHFTIDVASLNTNQQQRDDHLRSADFFEAEKYPQIKFQSTAFKKFSGSEYTLTGDLTIKETTKSITFKVEYGGSATDFYGNLKAGFEVVGKISRKDFGLQWNGITEAGAIVVGDEIKLTMNVQFSKEG